MKNKQIGICIAGLCAGAVNGLFGAAGGMVLVPLLTALSDLKDDEIFTASISIILPVCIVSLCASAITGTVSIAQAFPYLIGGAVGGIIAGKYGHRIPVIWLHRGLGAMILWGGFRYLC